jgi:enoyl-CoA hydratase/carnithine racemase
MFDRPDARNAMTEEMEEELLEVCKSIPDRGDVKVVIFTGAPSERPAFMAGADFGSLANATTREEFVNLERGSELLLTAIESIRVPTIAAMAGPCVGGGALLAMCCDVRIAAPSLKFGFPIAKTVGNCLSVKNYARLVDAFGASVVKEMLFSARLLRADELAQLRAIREVVVESDLHSRAQDIANQLLTLAPLTLWATKEALFRLRGDSVNRISDEDILSTCYMSSDFHEGVQAFLDKRPPKWQGR